MMPEKKLLSVLAIALVIGSGGCKEVQLGGPVENADVYMDLLNAPGVDAQASKTSSRGDVIEEYGVIEGSAKWSAMNEHAKLLRVGNFEVNAELVNPQALYLVVASYGNDVDADRNGRYDFFPVEILGEWRAIMSGQALLEDANVVSALTEAAYQYVEPDIGFVSDAKIRMKLDEFAQLVVNDVNRDGTVDYSDVLRWNRRYSVNNYLGDIAFLDNLADVIRANEREFVRDAAAASVWLNKTVTPTAPNTQAVTRLGGNVDGDVVLGRGGSPYSIATDMVISGNLVLEPGVNIKGNNRIIFINGNLIIDGAPRQPNEIENLQLLINNSSDSSESSVRNAMFDNGRLSANTLRFTMENVTAKNWELQLRSTANKPDNMMLVRTNVFESSRITFYNNLPSRDNFEIEFVNNLFPTSEPTGSQLITAWHGPVANLKVRNNSFNPMMRILRSGANPVLNLRDNYWGAVSISEIDFDEVIPENDFDSDYVRIGVSPQLSNPHPDTPLER